jgi:hypothetical protein
MSIYPISTSPAIGQICPSDPFSVPSPSIVQDNPEKAVLEVVSDPSSLIVQDNPENVVLEVPEGVVSDPVLRSETGSSWYIHGIGQPPPSEPLFIKSLEKWPLQKVAKLILGWERFGKCYHTPIASTVEIWRHSETRKAFFKNLSICGLPWVCSVCSSKITERRRSELDLAIERAKAIGLNAYLVTLTAPHIAEDALGDLLTKFSRARFLMKNRKQWKAWALRVGLAGEIRALEVTHGFNSGWHVHTHSIIFCKANKLEAADILPAWKSACLTAGLNEPNERGVDIRTGDDAVGDYVSKWGLSSEMTKSMSKRGRMDRRSPFDLLREYLYWGDEIEADLFREYANNFRGKRQLAWSEGLRDLLGLGVEKTDEEVAQEPEKGNELLAAISLSDWRLIMKYRYDIRAQVLMSASSPEAIINLIEKVKKGKSTLHGFD